MQLANVGRFKYTCSFSECELHFKRKDQLDSHEYTHSQVKKFKCPESDCSKSYVNNAHLKRHINNVHKQSNDIIQCEFEDCGAFFNSEYKLKLHINKIHTGRCSVECGICSEKFRRKINLRQHMYYVHTGNYNYNCSKKDCKKGFHQLSHLKRHEKTHDLRKCNHPKCINFEFDSWSSLVKHRQKEHSNTLCTICGQVCLKRTLKTHQLTHMNAEERLIFQCPAVGCPKFFLRRHSAVTHFKSKHENRSFLCNMPYCGQKLSTKQKLHQHILALHSSKIVCTDNVEESKKRSTERRQTERKDKGVQRISTASKLFNIVLPIEMERAIILGKADNIYLNHNQKVEENQENLSS